MGKFGLPERCMENNAHPDFMRRPQISAINDQHISEFVQFVPGTPGGITGTNTEGMTFQTNGYGLCQFWSHKKANVLTPSYLFECVKKGLTVNTEWSNICLVTECLVENSYEDMFSLRTTIMYRSYNLRDLSSVFFVWLPFILLSFCEELYLSFDACKCLSWKQRWFIS